MKRALSFSIVVSLLSYGALIWGGATKLALPSGLQPFDLRIEGYGATEVRTYLVALPADALDWYLGPSRWLDTVFPLAFTLTLLLILWRLTGGWGLAARLVVLAVPVVYGLLDLAENAAVATLLRAGPDAVDPWAAARASGLTQAKFLAVGAAILIAGSLGWRAWARR